jgi:tRNA 2-thiocytidine biosynthesis protein TtcA
MQKILGQVRRACQDYNMIEDGDVIGVGLSGGKDSLLLVKALAMYSRFSQQKFKIEVITIDLFNGESNYQKLKDFCDDLGVNLTIIKSNIYEVLFEVRKEKNPCSLCAKMRRGALNEKAKELGCNKIALGHHADDLIETMFLSMFYEGRLSSFHPISYMDRIGLSVIRPLIYVEEKDIVGVVKRQNFPVMFNCCPANKNTQREYVKQLLNNIKKDIPFVKERIHSALTHTERYNLFDKIDERFNIKK